MGKDSEKFLFNQHIFDEPEIEEDEHEEPPPPTYSQEELETAKEETYRRAYEQGKKDGLKESAASREQMVAQVLQKIGEDATALFVAETAREKIFEEESVKLALTIFQKLFPEQKTLHGFEELSACLTRILKKQENQSEIRIEAHPDTVEGVQNHIGTLSLPAQSQQRFDIIGNDSLDALAIKIYWKDGGAVKDISAIAEEIRTILHDTLAGTDGKRHDSRGEEQTIPKDDGPIGTEPASADIQEDKDTQINQSAEPDFDPNSAPPEDQQMEKPDE
ncbi:MAG: hypothetical protein ACLFR0_00020 [Alphaproteobacteria bacterium]